MGFLWKLSGVSLLEPPELLRNRLSMGTDFIQPFFLWLTPQLISLSPFFFWRDCRDWHTQGFPDCGVIMHSSLSRAPEMLALPFKGLTFVTVSFAVYGSLGFQAANGFVMLPAGPGPLNIVPHSSAGPHNET